MQISNFGWLCIAVMVVTIAANIGSIFHPASPDTLYNRMYRQCVIEKDNIDECNKIIKP